MADAKTYKETPIFKRGMTEIMFGDPEYGRSAWDQLPIPRKLEISPYLFERRTSK